MLTLSLKILKERKAKFQGLHRFIKTDKVSTPIQTQLEVDAEIQAQDEADEAA